MIDMKHWQEDPRLKQMDPKKLQYITDFAGRLTSMSKNQLIPALLSFRPMRPETTSAFPIRKQSFWFLFLAQT